MGDFRGNSRFGGNRSFGGRDFGGRSGPREMFRTTCSKCGKDCEVPFKPTGMKPVYCSDCFDKNGRDSRGGTSDSRRFDDRGPRRPSFEPRGNDQPQNRSELNAINAKLDKILSILSPTPVREEKSPAIELDEIIMPEEKKAEETVQSEQPKAPKKKRAPKKASPTPEE